MQKHKRLLIIALIIILAAVYENYKKTNAEEKLFEFFSKEEIAECKRLERTCNDQKNSDRKNACELHKSTCEEHIIEEEQNGTSTAKTLAIPDEEPAEISTTAPDEDLENLIKSEKAGGAAKVEAKGGKK